MTAAADTLAHRRRVLVLIGGLWPGNDASGPNLSLLGMAQALHAEYEFRFVARDRPFGAREPVAAPDTWEPFDHGVRRLCSPGLLGVRGLRRLLRETAHDILLLNGFHDRDFTIPALVLRRLGQVPRRPTILSSRGEFAAGARGLKAVRKRAYQTVAHCAGLLDDVLLHATSEAEREDISRHVPWSRGYPIAPNVRAIVEPCPHIAATDGTLRLAFVGRISPVKNLDYALHALRGVRVPVTFAIYGPIGDAAYWRACQGLIASLPAHVAVRYHGEIPNTRVRNVLAAADLFFQPTRGENFGHAIFEALSCGVPVLISDQTPWQHLPAAHAGWDLPLADPQNFAHTIDRMAAINAEERQALHRGARRTAEQWLEQSDAVASTRRMLELALGSPAAAPPVAEKFRAAPANPVGTAAP